MESSVQSETKITGKLHRFSNGPDGNRLRTIRQEFEYINTIGKRFVAAFDRFQVHRALLAALQEIYDFSACCILLKGDPCELFIIPSYPLSASFLEEMIRHIASAANVIDFSYVDSVQLAKSAYLDAPDDLALPNIRKDIIATKVEDRLTIPLTIENRIIGLLSLFDERPNTFNAELLQFTTMIADYAAVALENVRLRERENALWREAELERQRLELILRSMAEGLLITDEKGAITSLNQSAQLLFAQAQIDVKHAIPLHELAAERSDVSWLPRFAEIIGLALAGTTITNQEIIVGDHGETVPLTISVSAAPLHDSSPTSLTNKSIGVVAVLNDVTTSKQIERLKDEFVSIVSHELRTPLTAIKGYTQHLVRRIERRLRKVRAQEIQPSSSAIELPESYDLRSLHIVQSQTEHLERLVNDLLDLSKVQGGQLDLRYEEFYLADVLAENVHSVQASAEQHTIDLDILVQDSKVVADRVRIGQVIGNILDNAVKYSPHGGHITVRLERQERIYRISVIDQGIGISPDYLDHIFERFYRVRNTASRHFAGVGLGLFVAKGIIDKHGGEIDVAANTGIGSTFFFTLPIKPRSGQLTAPLTLS